MDQIVIAAFDQTLQGPHPFVRYDLDANGTLVEHGVFPASRVAFDLGQIVAEISIPFAVLPVGRRHISYVGLISEPGMAFASIYAEAVAQRIWQKSFEADPLNRAEGRRLGALMARGGACDPAEALVEYLGEGLVDVEQWA